MAQLNVVPCAMPCSLLECPPGLFIFRIEDAAPCIGFKSEYGGQSVKELDVYLAESGEFFWGGTTTPEARAALRVVPAKLEPVVP